MQLRRLKNEDYKHWDEVWRLYEDSFPHYERRDREANRLKMEQDDQFYFCAAEDSQTQQLLGIICYWQWGNLCFCEHLATNPAIRNQGLGAKILDKWKSLNQGHKTLLEVDPPMDEIAVRRIGFYERCGFVLSDHLHIHPSFETPAHPHRLLMMSHPTPLTNPEFQEFRDYTLNRILK